MVSIAAFQVVDPGSTLAVSSIPLLTLAVSSGISIALLLYLQYFYPLGKYKRRNGGSVQEIIRSFQPDDLKFKNQKIHSGRLDNFLFSFENNMKEPPK